MLLYFDENGTLLEYLTYGSPARAGSTNFKVIAIFKDIDILTKYSMATINFVKPDLDQTSYPTMLMTKNINFVFDSSLGTSSYLTNGLTYKAYEFDFNSFNSVNDPLVLLDTPGLWTATITLLGSGSELNVQGVATFNVQNGIPNEDPTEIDIETLLAQIRAALANKLDITSDFYLRVIDSIPAVGQSFDPALYSADSTYVLYHKINKKFYYLGDGLTVTATNPSEIKLNLSEAEIETLIVSHAYKDSVSENNELITKGEANAAYVNADGDTMTGNLVVPHAYKGSVSEGNEFITKNEGDSAYANVSGATTENHIARFSDFNGNIKDSGIAIDDNNDISGIRNISGNVTITGDATINGSLKKGTASVSVDNIVYADDKNETQNINGIKNYTKLPESSATPTGDKQFVNKKFVTDITGDIGERDNLQNQILAEANARSLEDISINSKIDTINDKMMSGTNTTDNQLANRNFVNSTVATQTSNFLGNIVVTDLTLEGTHLTFGASTDDIEDALDEYQFEGEVTNNDYCYVTNKDTNNNTLVQRFKYNEDEGWLYEYALNNSSFNQQEWAAIDSGITAGDVAQISKNMSSLANNYDNTATYNIGDEVLYNGELYRCKTTISTAESWTASKWDLVNLADTKADKLITEDTYQAKVLSADLLSISPSSWSSNVPEYNPSNEYSYGDLVTYDGAIYMAKDTTDPITGEFNAAYWDFIGGGIKVYTSENVASSLGFVAKDDLAMLGGTTPNDDTIIAQAGIFIINILSNTIPDTEHPGEYINITNVILGTSLIPDSPVNLTVSVFKQHSNLGSVTGAITWNDINYDSFSIVDNKFSVDYSKIYDTLDVIEHFQVNGVEQTITNKTVNIGVPTKSSDLTLDNVYTKTESDNKFLPLAGGTMSGNITSQNIVPDSTTNNRSIGSSEKIYSNVYAYRLVVGTSKFEVGNSSAKIQAGGAEYFSITKGNGTSTLTIGTAGYTYSPDITLITKSRPVVRVYSDANTYADHNVAYSDDIPSIHLYRHRIEISAYTGVISSANISLTLINTSSTVINNQNTLLTALGGNNVKHNCSGGIYLNDGGYEYYGSAKTVNFVMAGSEMLNVTSGGAIKYDSNNENSIAGIDISVSFGDFNSITITDSVDTIL